MKKLVSVAAMMLLIIPAASAQGWDNEGMPIRDLDGNVYRIIMTESGVWTANNLTTFKLNDGTPLKYVSNRSEWENTKVPAYGFFNTDVKYAETYGAIYNWYAVSTGKLCPKGYHVPTVEEWVDMMDYAGGSQKSPENPASLKEAGTAHWKAPNNGASNVINFTALPAGYLSLPPFEDQPGERTAWWTSTEDKNNLMPGEKPSNAEIVGLSYNFKSRTMGTYPKEAALPVRCKADE